RSQSEVLREGLRLLKEREELKKLRFAQLRREVAIGIDQADAGHFVDGPRAFAKIRQRSDIWKRARGGAGVHGAEAGTVGVDFAAGDPGGAAKNGIVQRFAWIIGEYQLRPVALLILLPAAARA